MAAVTTFIVVGFALTSANLLLRAKSIARSFNEHAERLSDYPLWRLVQAFVGTPWQVRLVAVAVFIPDLLLETRYAREGFYLAPLGFIVLVVTAWWQHRRHVQDHEA